MVAPLFQFTFLCVVSLGNLCLGFVIASRLGLGPSLGALFQLEAAAPAMPFEMTDGATTLKVLQQPTAPQASAPEAPRVPSESAVTTESDVADQQITAEAEALNEDVPVADAFNQPDDTTTEVTGPTDDEANELEAAIEPELASVTPADA